MTSFVASSVEVFPVSLCATNEYYHNRLAALAVKTADFLKVDIRGVTRLFDSFVNRVEDLPCVFNPADDEAVFRLFSAIDKIRCGESGRWAIVHLTTGDVLVVTSAGDFYQYEPLLRIM